MSENEYSTSTESSDSTEDSTTSDSDSESSYSSEQEEEEDKVIIDEEFKQNLRMLILCVELNKLRNQKNI